MLTENFQRKILVVDCNDCGLTELCARLPFDSQQLVIEPRIDLALEQFESIDPALVLVSVEPPSLEGLKIINRAQQQGIAIIAASFDASAETSACAIRSGATDFLDLNLPNADQRLARRVSRAWSLVEGQREMGELEHPLLQQGDEGFIGASKSMLDVSKLIINAAKSNASVFITGENGTGKEVCAELIHRYSQRSEHPLVTLNCAAIPKGLAESEMFGHVKGSFTGAIGDRTGVARQAHNSTLFLDEIGEMEMDIQSKLLRFVQTGVFNRVGSSQPEHVDVRFICATNRDPAQQIEDGDFRQDLFYRLNVIQIHLPPLRDRGEDILLFANKFLQDAARTENKPFEQFSPETQQLLLSYSWPGNVRELQNVVRSIVVLHDGDTVIPSMLPLPIIREKGERRRRQSDFEGESPNMLDKLRENVRKLSDATQGEAQSREQIRTLDDVVEETIKRAIDLCDGNIADAAHRLGVSPSTLYRKIKANR